MVARVAVSAGNRKPELSRTPCWSGERPERMLAREGRRGDVLRMRRFDARALPSEAIDPRCLGAGIAVDAQGVRPKRVDRHQEHIEAALAPHLRAEEERCCGREAEGERSRQYESSLRPLNIFHLNAPARGPSRN